MDDSKRRKRRLIVIGVAALAFIGLAAWQHWAPVLAVPGDARRAEQLLAAHGLRSDYSPASLWDVDRYLEDGAPGEGMRDAKLQALGSYAGEVIRRAKGGSWVAVPSAPGGVELALPDGTRCSPHGRAQRRVEGPRDESVALYAQSLGVDVRPVPEWWLKVR